MVQGERRAKIWGGVKGIRACVVALRKKNGVVRGGRNRSSRGCLSHTWAVFVGETGAVKLLVRESYDRIPALVLPYLRDEQSDRSVIVMSHNTIMSHSLTYLTGAFLSTRGGSPDHLHPQWTVQSGESEARRGAECNVLFRSIFTCRSILKCACLCYADVLSICKPL